MELKKIELGVISFIHNEIASKATGLMKFLIYSGTALGAGKIEKMVQQYEPLLKSLDVVNDEGIDLDKLYNAAKVGIKETGSIVVSGIILDEKDLDKLYNYIKEA